MLHLAPHEAHPFLVSKWLHIQFLIDFDEMQDLFRSMSPIVLFSNMAVQECGTSRIVEQRFLETYERYIGVLKKGEIPIDQDFRFYFTALASQSEEIIQAVQVGENREILRPFLPVMQLQLHRFDYSFVDGKIRPLVFGKETISWGLQVSYPQLFQDPVTRHVEEILKSDRFVNTALFVQLQQWIRKQTLPTPFLIGSKRLNSPIRIGKNCLSWIHSHAELQARGLAIQL